MQEATLYETTPRPWNKSIMTKSTLIAAAVLSLVAVVAPARSESLAAAGESRAYLHSNNLPSSGLALEGYCPVAYFAVNKPVRGKPEFASIHDDVTYHFVSADAKEAFDANSEKYVPAFGGWCAFGMAVSDKFPIDPTNFKIVDGKLLVFLKNRNVDALELWNDGNERELLKNANAHWASVEG